MVDQEQILGCQNRRFDDDGGESFIDVVVRNIHDGDISGRTIALGVKSVARRLIAPVAQHFPLAHDNIRIMEFRLISQAEDYKEVEGLQITNYQLTKGRDSFLARVYQFPADSWLGMAVATRERGQRGLRVEEKLLQSMENAIGALVGPTTKNITANLPNNGFYLRNSSLAVPFSELQPDQRKGAFALTLDKDLKLLTNEEVKTAVVAGFEGFSFVVGTSFYIKNEDNPSQLLKLPRLTVQEKRNISYLVQYQSESFVKNCYLIVGKMIEREEVFHILNADVQLRGAQRWMAVELEYTGAEFITWGKYGPAYFNAFQPAPPDRPDHYLLMRDTQSKS